VDLTHIARAEETGRVTLLAGAVVARLDTDDAGRATQAVYVDGSGARRSVRARVFVLAGGGVENVRLLLASRSAAFPDGLGNRSGLVGKHFTSHPAVDVTGRVERSVRPYRIGFSTAMSRQYALGSDRARRASFMLEFLNSAGLPPHLIALTSELSGDALQRHVASEFGHTLGIRVYCEQLPDLANTVDLDPSTTDHVGLPVPRLTWNVGDYERRGLQEAADVAAKILRTAGAADIRIGRLSVAAHQIGTHRMGRDPRTSVTDPQLRLHDVPNVYVLGSGAFPTASSSPPTLTIAALAIRASEHIANVVGPAGRAA
jgi:choline dehydrogenase-like flavoprotein